MSAAEVDAGVAAALGALVPGDNVGLLLGAGASVAAGLPDWDSLAARLLVESEVVRDVETAHAFLARQDPALAAEAARAASPDWFGLVRTALYAGDEPEPAALHLAAAALAAQQPAGAVRLHTLNLDPLLGTALRQALVEIDNPASVYERAEGTPRAPSGDHEVHHLHGLLAADGSAARGVILTLQDFVDLSKQPRPWQVATLQDSLQRGPLILAGTSYRDPDVRQWLSELESDHEVVVLLAREGLGLDRDQFARVQAALIAQWAAINVQAVVLQDHADAAQVLRELPYLHRSAYSPPQERAQALWERHREDFTRLQGEHAAQLEADLARLRPHLGDQANLTLWLADGTGQLIRWAAQDRLYRHPDQLRRVAVGHDSLWVAGQCLGRNDPIARDLADLAGSTRRWRSVVASPVVVELDGGPAFPAAALSSAVPEPLHSQDVDAWEQTLTELAEEWGRRLAPS